LVERKLVEQKKVLEIAVGEQNKKAETSLKNLQTTLKNNADEVSSANKRFYNEFAETVKTRLDDNKLQIKQLIDQDSQKTQQHINELKNDTQIEIKKLSKQLNSQKLLNLAFGIILAILFIVNIIVK
jgi:hypothetical protein